MSAAIILTASACSIFEKSECAEKTKHFHLFESDYGAVTIYDSEFLRMGNFYWTDTIIPYSAETKAAINLNLAPISENVDYILSFMETNYDGIEYEYTYETDEIDYYNCIAAKHPYSQVSIDVYLDFEGELKTCVHIPVYKKVLKTTFSRLPNTDTLTGNATDATYRYIGYKIIWNEETKKYEALCSPETENLIDIAQEYPYMKLNNFCVRHEGEPYEKNYSDILKGK